MNKKNVLEFLYKYRIILAILTIYLVGELIFNICYLLSSDHAVLQAGTYIAEENNFEKSREYTKYTYLVTSTCEYVDYYDVRDEQEIINVVNCYNEYVEAHPFVAGKMEMVTFRFFYNGFSDNAEDYSETLIEEFTVQGGEQITREVNGSKIELFL